MFQVGDIVVDRENILQGEQAAYGVVTRKTSDQQKGDGIHILWFHRNNEFWYSLRYAFIYFKNFKKKEEEKENGED